MARVALWFDRLDVGDEEARALLSLLGPAEQAQAARFRFPLHRRRFIVRRARLRQWLGLTLGIAPQAVTIVTDDYGKPAVPGLGGHFNASHSGELMLIAAAPVELGCDIERVDPGIDWRPLAERLFADEEKHALGQLNDEDGRLPFFRVWSRKEGYVKAMGQGLSYPLDAFAVSTGETAQLLRGADGWDIAGVPLPEHTCAVVARTDGAPLTLDIIRAPGV